MGLFDGIAKLFGGALGGPLVSAGASLIGGALNNKQRNKELSMSDPAYIRQQAEAAGFNPLLFTNQAFQNSSNVPTFGSALADAGHFLGEGMLRNQEMKSEQALRITELQQQNERLTELMRRTTFASNSGPRLSSLSDAPIYENANSGIRTGGSDPWLFDPNVADAEAVESRLGDFGQEAFGAYVAYKDLMYNFNHRNGIRPSTSEKLDPFGSPTPTHVLDPRPLAAATGNAVVNSVADWWNNGPRALGGAAGRMLEHNSPSNWTFPLN